MQEKKLGETILKKIYQIFKDNDTQEQKVRDNILHLLKNNLVNQGHFFILLNHEMHQEKNTLSYELKDDSILFHWIYLK